MRSTLTYIVSVVVCNVGFSYVPLVKMWGGEMWPPMSLLVGFVFVLRDYAQMEIGHKVWIAMLIGVVLSYFMASPFVALASGAAFLISEAIDWAVYTWTKRSFAERILLSSLISTPIDSIVFLSIIGHLSVTGVVVMTLSKLLGAMAVYRWIR